MNFLGSLIGLNAPFQVDVAVRVALGVTIVAAVSLGIRRMGAVHDAVAGHRLLSVALLAMLCVPLVAPRTPLFPVPYTLPAALAGVDNLPRPGPVRLAIGHLLGVGLKAGDSGSSPGPGPAAWLFLVWVTGVVALGTRQLIGLARLRRRCCTSSRGLPDRLQRIARRAGAANGDRPVAIRLSDEFTVPVTFGIRRPMILLPSDAVSWPDPMVTAALKHELAHVSRRDWLWQMLGTTTCTVLWFHPLVWLVARAQRDAAELAADANVVSQGMPASTYARILVDVARRAAGTAVRRRAAVAFEPTSLERRIAALANRRACSRRRTSALLLLIVASAVVSGAVTAPTMVNCGGGSPAVEEAS
ncbi:MAG: M56 family metallopeptidase [Gemmatimonadales bacterium]